MKKKIPLSIYQVLHPVYEKNADIIEQLKPTGEHLFHVKDRDPESDFLFLIIRQIVSNSDITYEFYVKPQTKDKLKEITYSSSLSILKDSFDKWIAIIREFNATPSIFDYVDPILKTYEDRYYKEFRILDEDAETEPYELPRQLQLYEFLEVIETKIEDYKADQNEEDIQVLEEIKLISVDIRVNISKLTKQEIVIKFAKLFAKIQKFGLPLLKKVVYDGSGKLTEKLIEQLFTSNL